MVGSKRAFEKGYEMNNTFNKRPQLTDQEIIEENNGRGGMGRGNGDGLHSYHLHPPIYATGRRDFALIVEEHRYRGVPNVSTIRLVQKSDQGITSLTPINTHQIHSMVVVIAKYYIRSGRAVVKFLGKYAGDRDFIGYEITVDVCEIQEMPGFYPQTIRWREIPKRRMRRSLQQSL